MIACIYISLHFLSDTQYLFLADPYVPKMIAFQVTRQLKVNEQTFRENSYKTLVMNATYIPTQ